MIIKNKTRFVNLLKAVCNNNEHVCETLSVSANNPPQEIKIVGEKTDGHPIILLPVSNPGWDFKMPVIFFQCVIFTEGGWGTRLGDPQSPTPHPQKMT